MDLLDPLEANRTRARTRSREANERAVPREPIAAPAALCILRAGAYRSRITIGQLTTIPVERKGFPFGPVIQPFLTMSRNWNSSISRER